MTSITELATDVCLSDVIQNAKWVDKIKPIIQEELAAEIDEVFDDFNEEPIASASISQVYLGILKEDGNKVVLKVRKPGVVETIKGDMEILFWVADLMQKNSTLANNLDFKGIIEEFFLSIKVRIITIYRFF